MIHWFVWILIGGEWDSEGDGEGGGGEGVGVKVVVRGGDEGGGEGGGGPRLAFSWCTTALTKALKNCHDRVFAYYSVDPVLCPVSCLLCWLAVTVPCAVSCVLCPAVSCVSPVCTTLLEKKKRSQ